MSALYEISGLNVYIQIIETIISLLCTCSTPGIKSEKKPHSKSSPFTLLGFQAGLQS